MPPEDQIRVNPSVDRIVSELLAEGEGQGSLQSMIHKIIWSHAFRKRRGDGSPPSAS